MSFKIDHTIAQKKDGEFWEVLDDEFVQVKDDWVQYAHRRAASPWTAAARQASPWVLGPGSRYWRRGMVGYKSTFARV